jgi:hypothetical protein
MGERFAAFGETRAAFFDVDPLAETFRAGLDALWAADFFTKTFFFLALAIIERRHYLIRARSGGLIKNNSLGAQGEICPKYSLSFTCFYELALE